MRQLIIVFLLVISFVGWTNAQQTVTVDSKSNIFAAGRDNVSDPGGGGGGILPIELPLNCGVDYVNFTEVTGEISCTAPVFAGPDGKTGTNNISAFQGISGVYHQNSRMSLVGVFLDNSVPNGNWSGGVNNLQLNNFENTPVLNQIFFIGDGLTGTGIGDLQIFYVPDGATRLFIGFADAPNWNGPHGWYNDNAGSLDATVVFNGGYFNPLSVEESVNYCKGSSGAQVVLSTSGGSESYSYEWSNGSTSPILTDLSPDTYDYTITDNFTGCELTGSIDIINYQELEYEIETSNACEGESNGSFQINITNGNGPFEIIWNNNELSGLSGNNLNPGDYLFSISDAFNCSQSGVINIEEELFSNCTVYTVDTPSSCDAADGILSLCTVESGYEVLWNTGSTSVDLTDVGSGEYTVTITSPSGCASTCSTTLTASNSLGNFVWYDIDKNGQQDAGEAGIQGIEISLHEVNNGFISSTISDADGYYLFEGLSPGAYYVTVESQIDSDMDFTFFNGGGNESLDSDIDPDTGKSDLVFIYGGICHEDLDIGLNPLCIELDFGGTIGYDQVLCGTGNVPDMLVELSPATGSLSNLEYVWMYSYNYTTTNNGTWYPITSSNSPNFQPPSTDVTMYFMRFVRPVGCENFLESNVIEVYADYSVQATFYGLSYSCVNETETISAVDVGQGATYEWYLNDIALNLPPTTLSFNQLISQPGINEIRMVVTKGDCVVESTDLFYVFDDPDQCNPLTPLQEDNNEAIHTDSSLGMIDFSIIPNLVQSEQVKLSFNGFKWSEVDELRIMSIEGKTQQYDINQESEEILSIQLDNFGSGIYMINIVLGNGTQLNKKFIVQN